MSGLVNWGSLAISPDEIATSMPASLNRGVWRPPETSAASAPALLTVSIEAALAYRRKGIRVTCLTTEVQRHTVRPPRQGTHTAPPTLPCGTTTSTARSSVRSVTSRGHSKVGGES